HISPFFTSDAGSGTGFVPAWAFGVEAVADGVPGVPAGLLFSGAGTLASCCRCSTDFSLVRNAAATVSVSCSVFRALGGACIVAGRNGGLAGTGGGTATAGAVGDCFGGLLAVCPNVACSRCSD